VTISKRVNFNDYEDGEQYRNRLNDEANRNFNILIKLLSSYYISTIDGPNYARELKAVAIELSRIRMSLNEVRSDTYFTSTRGEFLYQVLTSLLFPNGAPDPKFPELDFRDFLNEIVAIYFKGSIPPSIQRAAELLTNNAEVIVKENFEEAKNPGSGFDISDQFGFTIDVIMKTPVDFDIFLADKNIRILLSIIRPAHTLFRLGFILEDEWPGSRPTDPNDPNGGPDNRFPKISDTFKMLLDCYNYEDFRKFVLGVEGIDKLGVKKSVSVTGEDHSLSF
jgi:hypothetical protein